MKALRKIFYKIILMFVRNKHKRKNYYKCFVGVGIRKYFELAKSSAIEKTENRQFKYNVSILCIIKNEGPYLKEWIEYHKLIGIEHFYVYDNESNDDTNDILKPYIESGLVTYVLFPGKDAQEHAYFDAVTKFKNETKWLTAIDLDEFIVLHEKKNISDFMEDYADCSQVSLRWMIYGSSGHEKEPKGLVIENFKSHAKEPTFSPKSIFNPRTVVWCGAHYMWLCGKWVDENGVDFGATKELSVNKAQINHYVIKSWEEFYRRKAARGCVDNKSFGEDLRKYFNIFDINDVTDDLMKPYAEKLKEIIKK